MPLFSSFAEDGASQLNNNTANKNVIAPADETSEQRLRGSTFEENQISRDAESNSPIAVSIFESAGERKETSNAISCYRASGISVVCVRGEWP
jgi:hypothetical protein